MCIKDPSNKTCWKNGKDLSDGAPKIKLWNHTKKTHFPVFAKNFRRPWMKLNNFFCQFPNPWTLRVSGMGCYTSKCKKKSKSLHPTEHTRKRFYRTLSIQGYDFIAHWTYEERISVHARPEVKWEQFLHVNPCWAYAERISSHTEHTRNEFHRWLSIRGMDFLTGWPYAEMFKSRISRQNRIWYSKISCYRPLGP